MSAVERVRIASAEPVAAGAMVWRTGGQLYVTVVAKATFALVSTADMELIEPAALVRAELHHKNNPTRTVRATTEIVPYLPRAEVVLTGHACAPRGAPATRVDVRLAIFRDHPVLDKTLHVHGDRKQGERQPFERMPLVYERSLGGIGSPDNPFGVGAALGADVDPGAANILDPADPQRTAGFGPLTRNLPSRKKLLGGMNRKALDEPIVEIPPGFDWTYFHAAPADQRVQGLLGDEWILLEGVHPDVPEIRTRLPGARPLAYVRGVEAEHPDAQHALDFHADMLVIDTDAQTCSLVWRALLPIRQEAQLSAMKVLVGLELPGYGVAWPEEEVAAEPEAAAAQGSADAGSAPAGERAPDDFVSTVIWSDKEEEPRKLEAPRDVERTRADEPEAPQGPALPFVAGTGGPLQPATPPSPPKEQRHSGTVAASLDEEPPPERIPFAGARPPRPAPPRPAPPASTRPLAAPPRALPPPRPPPARPVAAPPLPSSPAAPPLPPSSPEPQKPPAPQPRTFEHTTAASLDDDAADRPATPFARFDEPAPKEAAARGPSVDVPPRITDAIPFVHETPFIPFTLPWGLKAGRGSLVVVIKATCDIVPDEKATLRAEGDPPSGDVHADDDPMKTALYPSDFAIFKPRADVVLSGHAYAPGGGAPAAQAELRFGKRDRGFVRRVAVFGERRWEGPGLKLAPTHPQKFRRVPLSYERAFGGPDFEKNPVGIGRSGDLLPQLEAPESLVTSPSDTPEPTCFAAIPPRWPSRWSKIGTYDADWQKDRFPYFPADFDWSFFQCAPQAQQLDYLEGDEPFELVGVHPSHPKVKGALPGVRPRCFVQQTAEAGGGFHEVTLRLDTVSFHPDDMKVCLVWRGLVEVSDDDAPEIGHLFVMAEPTSGARASLEAARAAYREARKPKRPEAVDEGPVHAPAPQRKPKRRFPPQQAALRRVVLARLEASAPLDGLDLSGADLSEIDFSGQSLKGSIFTDTSLRGCQFKQADLSEAQLGGADLSGADLSAATLHRADFSFGILEDARFDGAVITEASFHGARGQRARFVDVRGKRPSFIAGDLSSARFDRAEMEAADFTEAILHEVVFDGAKLPSVRLFDANGTRASFKEAALEGARADGVKLPKSSFQQAVAPSSTWDGALLDDSTFRGAVLTESSFARASCNRALFAGADLAAGRLRRAKLQQASFVKANLLTAQLEGADLTSADLRGANLHGAETFRAKLKGAQLTHAIVTQTKLKGQKS